MGIPFYARTFLLNDQNNFLPGPSATISGGFAGAYTQENGYVSYVELCLMDQEGGWTKRADSEGNFYMTKGKMWAGLDTHDTIKKKVIQITYVVTTCHIPKSALGSER